jgi:hypothetical protein
MKAGRGQRSDRSQGRKAGRSRRSTGLKNGRRGRVMKWGGVCVMSMWAGGAVGESVEPRWLIEVPTAGVLARGGQAVDVRLSSDNGALGEFEFGLWHRVLVSVSFGGQHLVGGQSAEWNPDPGVSGRIRVLNETGTRPALAVGFRSQGSGSYDDPLKRYQTKSLGVYGVFSRNYRHDFGQGGIHFGLNRSLESGDGDETLTGFVGSDIELAGRVTLLGEYHFGFNDDDSLALGRGRGYMNFGLRLNVTDRLAVEFDLKDVLENNVRGAGAGKEVRVVILR